MLPRTPPPPPPVMESEMLQSPLLGLGEDDEADLTDWNLPLAFMKKRHCEKIEGSKSLAQSWRMKDRMKTVSVALVLCLNVGVDPPDVVKTTPCARLECWIDPLSMGPQKALETIGANLQKQYENWQPRARYKQSLDPTVDEVKKLCTSLRRNAKEERVLFHYNGHGVPRPTVNGEIWVFNKVGGPRARLPPAAARRPGCRPAPCSLSPAVGVSAVSANPDAGRPNRDVGRSSGGKLGVLYAPVVGIERGTRSCFFCKTCERNGCLGSCEAWHMGFIFSSVRM